jgi:hypothetical protein
MPIRIRHNAEPFSHMAQPGRVKVWPILARSEAGTLIEQELRRYCNGEVRGRSFLIAGHRGSGKTTTVDNILLKFQEEAWLGNVPKKPLPIYLLGPTLLDGANGESDLQHALASRPADAPPPAPIPVPAGSIWLDREAARSDDEDEELLMHRVLVQVVLGLHHAVSKEFVQRFNDKSLGAGLRPEIAQDLSEMAAQFQIELTEAPPPSRLREFWERADVFKDGLLFKTSPSSQQGLRELVALTGITHVHQRVSGDLEEKEDQRTGRSKVVEATTGIEAKRVEMNKAIASVGAGAALGTAGIATGHTFGGLALGVLAVLASNLILRVSSSNTHRRERNVDRTFIPDLSIKTLHRVIPALLDRLMAAGLAPVFVVDELDKVDNLAKRIYPLIRNLKKLFAESSFTCLLVDRGFYENLMIREELEQRRSVRPLP